MESPGIVVTFHAPVWPSSTAPAGAPNRDAPVDHARAGPLDRAEDHVTQNTVAFIERYERWHGIRTQ